ncbi:heparan sulfate glucosamine 3-O-sulfotransferase 5-like isoform X2 [Eriocheir sinensis]|uniref:heparan sulfate glucosamine 3-O-sulfotransferase 5-like isoform X2 n=1 Tax=Eriocheir sinensis TaxID=95602 RepID=UPI0021C7ED66|nr:heparan sulfate glucosamine 3-O-sulfotransferase 5-like isoform X2 [Eriocheir sinensis]
MPGRSEESHLVWHEDLGSQAARGPLMGGRGESSSPWSALRRVAPLMILASFIVCLVLYYVSPMGAAAVYAASETTGLDSVTTEAYRKRLRIRGTQRRLPQALIIGVRKCGTRALLEMLNLHPHIQKNGMEMHFFDEDERYANGLEWYRKKMPYSFDNQVTIEKTPSYFISREAPARIRAMNSTIKLLLIVRDPATRVVSDYAQIMETKLKKGRQVAPFHKRVLTPDGEINDGFKAIQISQYAVHVLRWLREFPREQIHIINGDNLIRDPFAEINKVQQFLRLPPYITPDNFYFNETKGFYCMRNETFQKCLAEAKGRPHPYVDPTVMSQLRKFFVPFNEQFYEMVGQNFGWPTS